MKRGADLPAFLALLAFTLVAGVAAFLGLARLLEPDRLGDYAGATWLGVALAAVAVNLLAWRAGLALLRRIL